MNTGLLNSLSLFALEKPPEIRNFRICAAVVYKHKHVVSLGFPRRKSHPLQKQFGADEHKVFLHAEVDAILRALRFTKLSPDYSVYIARVKQNKQGGPFVPALGKPCKGCTRFIRSLSLDFHYSLT